MSFIELDGMDDLKEPELAPEGEYALMVTRPEYYTNDKGRGVIKMVIQFEDHDDYASFMHWIAMPSRKIDIDENSDGPEEGKKKYERMMLGVKRFLTLFSISMENGFDVEELQGARAVAGVVQEINEDNDQVNNRLKVPRIREED